jgi:hypothetical protein
MDEMSEDLFKIAKNQLDRVLDWENHTRKLWRDDFRFGIADSDNMYQWPEGVLNDRASSDKPCLTINKTDQHCLSIINDSKQNKTSVVFRPVGNDATTASANVWSSVFRHIEYTSNASTAYDLATEHQVYGGFGYWRVITDYEDETSFNQQILIRRILNPLQVALDPSAKEADKSDGRFGFIFQDVSREEAEVLYPQYTDKFPSTIMGMNTSWVSKNTLRIAEWYRKEYTKDTLFELPNGLVTLASEMGPELTKEARARKYRSRKVSQPKIIWRLLIGDEIVETKDWAGKYIPIVPLFGRVTTVDGILDIKGHVRSMKDAQRMYNYWSSSAVEFGALQTKTPFVGPKEAFEGHEEQWRTANRENKAYLAYNSIDDAGNPIPPPQRVDPPMSAPVALQGMLTAQQEMAMVSGQYDAQMGAPGNERSANAIEKRQRASSNAVYHFSDQQSIALTFTGKIILDLFPKIYDTQRTIKIIAEDGKDFEVEIDPSAKKAYEETQLENDEAVKRIFNPNIGKYDVQASVGQSFATKREETVKAIGLLLTQAPQLTAIIGDILMRAADFPMAQEAADRLRRMVPPVALGMGPSESEQQLQDQIEQLKGLLQDSMKELTLAQMKIKGQDEKRDIQAFDAITKRIVALKDAPGSEDEMQVALKELVDQILGASLAQINNRQDVLMNLAPLSAILPKPARVPGNVESFNGLNYRADPSGSARFLPVR